MTASFAWLGVQPYGLMWKKMQEHVALLAADQAEEVIWACEHEPVYTTGKRGVDNRLATLSAPLLVTDRGGETTFHGRGQVMLYPVVHLRRRGLSVRQYVHLLEESAIQSLANYKVQATRRCGMPGVWTDEGKIVAMGIRVSHGVAYHGMAMNMAVDMAYFQAINPCGLGQKAVNMSDSIDILPKAEELAEVWANALHALL